MRQFLEWLFTLLVVCSSILVLICIGTCMMLLALVVAAWWLMLLAITLPACAPALMITAIVLLPTPQKMKAENYAFMRAVAGRDLSVSIAMSHADYRDRHSSRKQVN